LGWLIGHVFLADVEHCSRCGGPMRWVEAATTVFGDRVPPSTWVGVGLVLVGSLVIQFGPSATSH
jgi:hypothetical protein